MHPAPPSPVASRSERRLLRWLLIGLGLLITPVVVVGVGVISMFHLNRDAAVLKREVMAATDGDWSTKVQVSAGWGALTTARTVLRCLDFPEADDARLALSAVRHASVGVYEHNGRADWSRGQLVSRTDERMRDRGWSRIAGVTDDGEAVLVYAQDNDATGDRLTLCVAVFDGRDLVVVSTRVEAEHLLTLVEKHLPETGLRQKLKQAKI